MRKALLRCICQPWQAGRWQKQKEDERYETDYQNCFHDDYPFLLDEALLVLPDALSDCGKVHHLLIEGRTKAVRGSNNPENAKKSWPEDRRTAIVSPGRLESVSNTCVRFPCLINKYFFEAVLPLDAGRRCTKAGFTGSRITELRRTAEILARKSDRPAHTVVDEAFEILCMEFAIGKKRQVGFSAPG